MRAKLAHALDSLDTALQRKVKGEYSETTERLASYTQVLFIFVIFRLNCVHSSPITKFKHQSRKRWLLAWQVRQDYCDDRITGCKSENVWPATILQEMGISGSDILLFEANDKNNDRIQHIT